MHKWSLWQVVIEHGSSLLQVLAQLLWCTARLRLQPDAAWLETGLQRAATFQWRCSVPACQAQGTSPGGSGVSSADSTQRRWQAGGRPSAQHVAAASQDLANIFWALAVQPHFTPGAERLQHLVAACVQCLPG